MVGYTKIKEKGVRSEKLASRFSQPFLTIFIPECGEMITQESVQLCVCAVKFTIIQNVYLNT